MGRKLWHQRRMTMIYGSFAVIIIVIIIALFTGKSANITTGNGIGLSLNPQKDTSIGEINNGTKVEKTNTGIDQSINIQGDINAEKVQNGNGNVMNVTE